MGYLDQSPPEMIPEYVLPGTLFRILSLKVLASLGVNQSQKENCSKSKHLKWQYESFLEHFF